METGEEGWSRRWWIPTGIQIDRRASARIRWMQGGGSTGKKVGREEEEFCESSPKEEGRVRGRNWEEVGGGTGRLCGEEEDGIVQWGKSRGSWRGCAAGEVQQGAAQMLDGGGRLEEKLEGMRVVMREVGQQRDSGKRMTGARWRGYSGGGGGAGQQQRRRSKGGGGGGGARSAAAAGAAAEVSAWLGQGVAAVVAAAAQRRVAAAATAIGLLPRPSVSSHSRWRRLLSFFSNDG